MALEFRWFTFQQVNGLRHVAFHFRESCELRCCFLFFISGYYFDHFLFSTHLSHLMPLESYVSSDERNWSGFELCISTHEFCINYGGTLCGALGLFQHFDLFLSTRTNTVLRDLVVYTFFKSCPCLIFIIKYCVNLFSEKVTENLVFFARTLLLGICFSCLFCFHDKQLVWQRGSSQVLALAIHCFNFTYESLIKKRAVSYSFPL